MGLVLFSIFINDLENGTEYSSSKFVADTKVDGVAGKMRIQSGLDT